MQRISKKLKRLGPHTIRQNFRENFRENMDVKGNIFQTFLGRGASWGALAVFEDDDDLDQAEKDLAESTEQRVKLWSVYLSGKSERKAAAAERKKEHARQVFIHKAIQIAKDIMLQIAKDIIPIAPPSIAPTHQCTGCAYKKHTNPPAHMTGDKKAHCCGTCFDTNGAFHGKWCERLVCVPIVLCRADEY